MKLMVGGLNCLESQKSYNNQNSTIFSYLLLLVQIFKFNYQLGVRMCCNKLPDYSAEICNNAQLKLSILPQL